MPVGARDPAATAATLTRWLAARWQAEDVELTDLELPGTTGWSNETILLHARWAAHGEHHDRPLVVRIAPSGHQVFPEDTFARQYHVLRWLASCPGVPVPGVLALEEDPSWFGRPFWLMERVDGDLVADLPPYSTEGWLHAAGPAVQERAWWSAIDAMAAIHRLDPAEADLPAGLLPDGPDRLADHLRRLEAHLTWAEGGTPFPLARRALELLTAARPPEPAEGPALCWGDARFSNLIYRDGEVAAVLDWEMAEVGDPLLDLGWWLLADEALTAGVGATRLPGFPSAEATGRRWAERTGRSAAALDWFVDLAALRFTVVMLRIGDLLVDTGLVPPGFGRDNLIAHALERRLAARG